jgi:hypothetical protein
MTEDFLQFIWQHKLLKNSGLFTVQNQPIEIINPGTLNPNQGPDFTNARIKIGNTLWAGNVEIHIKASDFYKHHHYLDKAYSNLILHVVYENDIATGHLPVLELKNIVPHALYSTYYSLIKNKQPITCTTYLDQVADGIKTLTLQQKFIERLEQKCTSLEKQLTELNSNWEQLFWLNIFKYLGGTVNAHAFLLLAQTTNFNYLVKHSYQPLTVEACLFGLSGLLFNPTINDEYYRQLQQEFKFHQPFCNKPLDEKIWRFMRLRPNGFPTIRISQLANLISKHPDLFTKCLNAESVTEIIELLTISANPYWNTHYIFGKTSTKKSIYKTIGKEQRVSLIINAIIPLLFTYGSLKNIETLKEKAINFMEQLPPENNRITRLFKALNFKLINAADTQGSLCLFNNYCLHKKCLSCSIGASIIKHSS